MLRDPTSDKWRKYWAVLRRPYLHLYESSSEAEEVTVINLSTVRVEQSPEIEQMLEVRSFSACTAHELTPSSASVGSPLRSSPIKIGSSLSAELCVVADDSPSQLLLPGTESEGDARLDQEYRSLPRYMIPRCTISSSTYLPTPYDPVFTFHDTPRLFLFPADAKYSS